MASSPGSLRSPRSPVLVAVKILKVYEALKDADRRDDMTRKMNSLIETMHHMAPELVTQAWTKLSSTVAYDSCKYGENSVVVALLRGDDSVLTSQPSISVSESN